MGKNKRNASCQAVIAAVLALSTACGLGILDEREFEFAYKGPPTVIIDDFETNDGFMSTKYLYEPERERSDNDSGWIDRTCVLNDWAYSGSYSLCVLTPVRLEVDLPMDLRISYVASSNSSNETADSLCVLSSVDTSDYEPVDGYLRLIDTQDSNLYIYRAYYAIPKGKHTLTLDSRYDYSAIYIDDLSIGEYLPFDPTVGYTALLSPSQATVDWGDIDGATSYAFQAATDAGFAALVADASGLSSSAYTIPSSVDFTSLYCRYGAAGVGDATLWSPPIEVRRAYAGETEAFDDTDSYKRWFVDPENSTSLEISRTSSEGQSYSPGLLLNAEDYGNGYCQTRVYMATGGTISFYYKNSSSSNAYEFYVDGDWKTNLLSNNWALYSISLSAGYHDLRFYKNYYFNDLYIDDLVVP